MNKLNRFTVSMTCICIILGIIIGIQLKSVKIQGVTTTTDMQRANELALELKIANEKNEQLLIQLNEAESKLQDFEGSLLDENKAIQLLRDELANMKSIAGLTDLTGRGVTVTLNDSSKNQGGADSNAFLVHAEDILSVINELKVAGAEAVSINGQRLIGTSAVRCSGSVVTINGVKIAAPFIITAIGDPDVMESALKISGGVVDSLSPWGIGVTIKKLDSVTVPAYRQSIRYVEASEVSAASEIDNTSEGADDV